MFGRVCIYWVIEPLIFVTTPYSSFQRLKELSSAQLNALQHRKRKTVIFVDNVIARRSIICAGHWRPFFCGNNNNFCWVSFNSLFQMKHVAPVFRLICGFLLGSFMGPIKSRYTKYCHRNKKCRAFRKMTKKTRRSLRLKRLKKNRHMLAKKTTNWQWQKKVTSRILVIRPPKKNNAFSNFFCSWPQASRWLAFRQWRGVLKWRPSVYTEHISAGLFRIKRGKLTSD